MLTICWAAKGGSGTTTTTAALALSAESPTLLVDLDGDLPLVLGVDVGDHTGAHDWLASTAPPDRLARLEVPLRRPLTLIPSGTAGRDVADARWTELGRALATQHGHVLVDAGTGEPPPALCATADSVLLVTRPCYLALRRAMAATTRPTGIILIDEPGRRFGVDDIEHSLGAPVVATVLLDPAIARAVDSGLLASRLPQACMSQLRRAAA